jgi:lipopolysaccharide transport system permease protein
LFTELFGIAMFVRAMLGFGREPSATALLLPLLLVPQILLTMGTAWFLAALGVVFRDLGQLIGFLLTIWFFTTPICYPEASLPQNFLWLFELNPLYVLVSAYRAVLLDGAAPDWSSFGFLTAGSAAWFVLGHAWFYKLKKSFADMV